MAKILASASIDRHGGVVFTPRCSNGWQNCVSRAISDAMTCKFFGCFEVIDYVALIECGAAQEDDTEV